MADLPWTRIAVVIDCEDPVGLAQFWAPALGYAIVHEGEPYTALIGDRPNLRSRRC